MVYVANSSSDFEKITVENGRIVYIYYVSNKNVCEMQREETYKFDNLLTKVMSLMMKDDLSQFKAMLKSIKNSDLNSFNKGKKMLEEERKKYEL